jgi:hypothetical protein
VGEGEFFESLSAAGVDGVIVVDYPPEEARDFASLAVARGLAPIFLLSPTTPTARMSLVAAMARGYVYYVSLKGVTGAGHLDTAEVAARLAEIRRHVSLPVGVGFGIRDAASAQAIAAHADAVVIGSRIIEEIERGPADEAPARAPHWLQYARLSTKSPNEPPDRTQETMSWFAKLVTAAHQASPGTGRSRCPKDCGSNAHPAKPVLSNRSREESQRLPKCNHHAPRRARAHRPAARRKGATRSDRKCSRSTA